MKKKKKYIYITKCLYSFLPITVVLNQGIKNDEINKKIEPEEIIKFEQLWWDCLISGISRKSIMCNISAWKLDQLPPRFYQPKAQTVSDKHIVQISQTKLKLYTLFNIGWLYYVVYKKTNIFYKTYLSLHENSCFFILNPQLYSLAIDKKSEMHAEKSSTAWQVRKIMYYHKRFLDVGNHLVLLLHASPRHLKIMYGSLWYSINLFSNNVITNSFE